MIKYKGDTVLKKIKNQLNIYKEFWSLANQANDLAQTESYDVDMLISAWKHQLTASNFFYGTLVNKEPNHDANKTYYALKTEPKEHQLIYTQIGRGYSKELFDPHWCYVLKHCGTKLIVIPVTSIKPDSSKPVVPYEYDIEEQGGVTARMHFDDMRCVDKMRIMENKGYISVVTKREDIEQALNNFWGFSKKDIDSTEK
jgi:hypothetical protein